MKHRIGLIATGLLVTSSVGAALDNAFYLRLPVYVHQPYAFADRRIGFLPADPRVPLPIAYNELWYLRVPGDLMPAEWERLRRVVQERHVPGLDLSGESNILTLEHLDGLTNLRLLKLAGTRVRDSDMDRLWPMRGLEVLVVNNRITDDGLSRMGQHPRLIELGLAGSRMTDKGLLALRNYPRLERLDLTGTQITDDGLSALASLPLKQLALGSGITQNGIRALASKRTLEQLDLSQTTVADAAYSAIANLPRLHTLFAGRSLTDAGLERLSHIASLRRLDLSGAHITDQGAQGLHRLKDLEELALSQTPVGDAAIEALAALKRLRFLEISDTRVTDAGFKHLAKIPSLQVISLSTVGSTEVGRFSAWGELPRLHLVIINGRPMTYEWMQTLREKRARRPFGFVCDVEAATEEAGEAPLNVEPLKDRGSSGAGLTGLKRIHYVESELDDVIPAPSTINQDNPQDTEKNFLGEFTVNAGPSGKKRPVKNLEAP